MYLAVVYGLLKPMNCRIRDQEVRKLAGKSMDDFGCSNRDEGSGPRKASGGSASQLNGSAVRC